jgi:hypothetical protein
VRFDVKAIFPPVSGCDGRLSAVAPLAVAVAATTAAVTINALRMSPPFG